MATQPLNAALHYLHRSLDSGTAGRSDGDLLARFTVDCDPAAFEELVRRYEAMVMSVCRRQLGDGTDADDAFQATFFILARKARSIRKPDAVGSWLHGVALRLSRQLLDKRSARQRWEEKLRQNARSTPAEDDPVHLASLRELGVILDDELRNLPAVCRAALVACHLKGLSITEAAHRLGVPASTLKSRLQRGRELLRLRLQRRGIGLSLTALTAVLAGQSRAGAAPPFVHVTVQAALCIATSRAATGATRAASLMTHALGTGALGKVSLGVCAVLAFVLIGLGAAFCTSPRTDTDPHGSGLPGQGVARAADQQEQARLDRLGDPLPPGAILRLGTARLRQPVWVTAIAFTADGKQLVSASNHVIRVWDAATGKEVRQLKAINIMGLAVSPLGKVMASAQNNNIQVWDLVTGEPKFSRHTPGFAVAISPDGRVLATGGRTGMDSDDPVVLWDLRTGNKLRSLSGSMYQVFGLAFSPNGKSLAAVSCGDSGFSPPKSAHKSARPQIIRLWDVETGKLQELDGHAGGATSLAFSPDGKVLATGGHDGALIWWNSATRKQLRKIKLVEDVYYHRKGNRIDSGGIHALAFAPNGKTIASANHDGTVRLFDAATGKQLQVLRGHAHSVVGVIFSPNGKILASGSYDQTVRLWDTTTGALLNPRAGHDGGTGSVLISPDARRAVTAGRDRTVRIWDLTTGQELRVLRDFKSAVESVALSPTGSLLAVGTEDGVIQLRDAASGEIRRELKGHSGSVRSLSFSPDGKTLASAAPSGERSNLTRKEAVRSLRIWEVGTGQELPRIQGSRNDWYARFSPDGKWLAAYERGVVLWDPATGKRLRLLDDLSDFAFHPDGQSIVGWTTAPRARGAGGGIGREKGMVRVSRLADGAELYRFEGPQRMPYIGGLFTLSPDGRLLALAANEGGGFEQKSLQIWEMSTGKMRRTLRGHGGEVTGFAFSPDGRVVLSASADTTALVWDLGLPLKPRPKVLSDKALESLWDDLGDADAERADAAIWALVAAPRQAPTLLKKNVRPTPAPPPGWRDWVKDLGSGQFAVREKAARALEALEERAYPLLKQELTGTTPLEVRRRIQLLLDKLAYPLKSPKTIRELRAVEVLEHIGTEPARQVLQVLAQGESGSRLTEEARASLGRLAQRKAP
jgi:RNA polymerase sigma factor (sigma-70 family)